MEGLRAKCRVAALVVLVVCVGLGALYGLTKSVPKGCVMTYMYPTYVPISTPMNVSSDKYGLFLYHEGWKKIDFDEHLKKLNGVPVLFIPGNGGSYKQVRSLAAESSRAYQGGPLEPTYYQEASFCHVESGKDAVLEESDVVLPSRYSRMLDWFAVDLEGEHSAMDGRILEEHTEYVVYAIHRVLDRYRESREARSREGAEVSGNLPSSVVLVGHSMGGFVARAALVHPHLRKSAVNTILTLSSPHQSPPVALQPSLGHYFAQVNDEWRKGYETKTTHAGRTVSSPALSHVVVVSISGGIYDYQVRSKLTTLDGIVPSTHGFMLASSGMKNVWLSMDHQSILWCNQLVVQISHTLLSMINLETVQPFPSPQKRLLVFTKMLQSGLPQSFKWVSHVQPSSALQDIHAKGARDVPGSGLLGFSSCPLSRNWADDGLEKDLYIQSTSVTVLAMDGRRRWLDIKKMGSDGKGHFIFVTNLVPCSGVRLHLWPDKDISEMNIPSSKRILEVTSKMVRIPSGPAPRQIEPGSQTEQAPPSAVLHLSPEEMLGYRFLTISVAPRPTVSGRPPPAASMAVGQFFNPKEGEKEFSPRLLLRTSYNQEEMFIKEDHPLAMNLSFSVSLGLLPVTLSLRTAGCGIKNSEQAEDAEMSSLCKLRCFPPVAVAWDSTSGLHIIPNLYSETIFVDSSPAVWDSSQGSDKTTVLLLVDPHCSYRISFSVSFIASAARFFLLYSPQIIGFMTAVAFFALMRQARAWELDLSIPTILTAIELNLRVPCPFLFLTVLPMIVSMVFSFLAWETFPPVGSYIFVSTACYLIANGFMIILILSSRLVLFVGAGLHVFFKKRWQSWEENFHLHFLHQVLDMSFVFYSLKVVRILRCSRNLVVALVSTALVIFVHPSLGLLMLLLSHAFNCHLALCSFLAASFRSHTQRKEFCNSKTKADTSFLLRKKINDACDTLLPLDDNYSTSPNSAKSFGDSQLEIFNYEHGVLILHVLALLMFVPSLVAWLQRIGMGQSFPWFMDSALCVSVILHGLCGSRPDINTVSFALPLFPGREFGRSLVYLVAGYYCFLSALSLAPYRAFYAMAAAGVICLASKIIGRRCKGKGDGYFRKKRRHSHRH